MKRFDFAAEVAKQLITVASAIIAVIVAFNEKFFSKNMEVFFCVLADLTIFIFSIIAGILCLGGLVHLVGKQEYKDSNSINPNKIRRPSIGREFVRISGTSANFFAQCQQIFFGFGLCFFIAIAVFDKSYNQSSELPLTGSQVTPTIFFLPTPNTKSETGPSPFIWSSFGVEAIALVIGGVLLRYGNGSLVKGMGAVAIASSLAMHGYLIKKIDIDSLIKIEPNIDKIEIKSEIKNQLEKLGALGPTHETKITGFDSGSPNLKDDMLSGILNVCSRWKERQEKNQEGLLLVIGATDRVRLSATAKLRYDSNFGLARARAEAVKSTLVECGVESERTITLVSGPRNTPTVSAHPITNEDFPEDRAVDIWAIWNWREDPK